MASTTPEEVLWPPDTNKQYATLDGLDFIQILQQWSGQVSELKKTLLEKTNEMENYKQELTALRMLAGIPEQCPLTSHIVNSIVTRLSNATYMDMANGDFTRPSLLQRIGIQANRERLRIPALAFCSDDYISLIQQLNHMQTKMEEEHISHASCRERNQSLCSNLQRLSHELGVVSQELKACKAEKDETQHSCKSHLVQHEGKLKDKDLEVNKYRKIISELRKTIDQQFNDMNKMKQSAENANEKLCKTTKSLNETKKQVDKYQRDVENKGIAIKLMQKSLKESNDRCTQANEIASIEKKRHHKRVQELQNELDAAKQINIKLNSGITQKERLINQQTAQLKSLENKTKEQMKQNEKLTTELADRYSDLEKLNESDALLRETLRDQAAKLHELSTIPQITKKKKVPTATLR